jgi:sugar/nucleoside kinase (ribokinase family)
MKKIIDLCGLGNSLVDIQFNVDDEVIAQLGLNKGEMKLFEKEDQGRILDFLKDKVPVMSSGGSAANSIIAFSKFGGKAAYKSLLGDDELGRYYANEFKEIGIDLHTSFLKDDPTGTCVVLITPDSERTMCTHLGATGKYGPIYLDEAVIAASKWIYIEGYKFSAEESSNAVIKAIEMAKMNNTNIAVTFSDVFITSLFRDKLLEVVAKSDLVFCNESEALSFSQKTDINDALAFISGLCPNVVITLGSKGALVLFDNKLYKIPSYPATPVDSTGAGDMFAGGFLYGLIETGNPEIAGNLGSYAAARVVSQLGARLKESHDEVKEYIFNKF